MPDADESRADSFSWSPELFREETAALKSVPFWRNYRFYSMLLLLLTAAIVYVFR